MSWLISDSVSSGTPSQFNQGRFIVGFLCLLVSVSVFSDAISDAKQSRKFAAQGDFAEALRLSEKAALAMRRQPQQYASYFHYVLDDAARLHYQFGQLDDAESYAKEALAFVSSLPSNNANRAGLAHIQNTLATVLFAAGKFQDAESAYLQSYAFYSSDSKNAARSVAVSKNLVSFYIEKGLLDEALSILEKNIAMISGQNMPDALTELYLMQLKVAMQLSDTSLAQSAIDSARQHVNQTTESTRAQYELVQAQYFLFLGNVQQAASNLSQLLQGSASQSTLQRASVLYSLANTYVLQGKIVEANDLYLQALAAYREKLHANHPAIGRTMHGLAIVNKNIGRFETSEKYYMRAIDIFKQAFGVDHKSVAASRLEYSLLLTHMKRFSDAELQSQMAIDMLEAYPKESVTLGYANASLGFAEFDQEKFDGAKSSFEKAHDLVRQKRGDRSPDLPPGLIKLAEIALHENEFERAQTYIEEAISILQSMKAETPYGLVKALSVDASIKIQNNEVASAFGSIDQAMEIMRKRLQLHRNSIANLALEEQREVKPFFKEYLDVTYEKLHYVHLNVFQKWWKALVDFVLSLFGIEREKSDVVLDLALVDKAFKAAQYPHMTSTASAISKMASRLTIHDPEVENMLRERDRLVSDFSSAQAKWIEHAATTSSSGADANTSQDILSQIARLDENIRSRAPNVSALTNPGEISLAELQSHLQEDEVLLLQITEKSGTFLFLVGANDIDISKTNMTSSELSDAVEKIRYSVDLTRRDISYDDMPDFAVAEAHFIYTNLLAPFSEKLESAKHIILVVDEAMQNIPPGLLLVEEYVVDPAYSIDYRALKFLGHEKALSVVPSPSALISLRNTKKARLNKQPFLGIGDPDMEKRESGLSLPRLTMELIEEQLFQKKNSDVLRSIFSSLPETRYELTEIAKIFNAKADALYFRDKATESQVKALSLNNYDAIAFATHGLLAGEFSGLTEPALVLTPPAEVTPVDDGLLMASEVANLELSADWVILSACNTAAPEGDPGAEGLSGLAKAFFYAGARSLLVSHWYIDSEASALLTTQMFREVEQRSNKGIRKAEALRLSMISLRDREQNYLSHPAFWSPFVVVGEGGY